MIHKQLTISSGYVHAARRPYTNADRERVREVLRQAFDDMAESESPDEMFEPYAMIVSFALANRRITRELAEQAATGYEVRDAQQLRCH